MEGTDVCLGLGLGLGLSEFSPKRDIPKKNNKRLPFLDLSIPIHDSNIHDHGDAADHHHPNHLNLNSNSKMIRLDQDRRKASITSKKEEEDHDINFSMNFGRKKLRLTREQTTLLEDSFRQHTTLNTAQKQVLAEKLNLKPRQVEVWFQNRRARSKLKQTEVECEILKKNCERLSDENRRLKKEVSELRSSLKMQKPAAAATPYFHHNQKAAEAAAGSRTGRGGGEKQAVEVVHEP